MTVRLVTLAPWEAPAAVPLAMGQSVAILAGEDDVEALRRGGFVEAPAAVECFVQAPYPRQKLTHHHRNSVRALKEWQRLGLDLELMSMGAFTFEKFLEKVYFPIFARAMFKRGITPHGAHEVAGMRALVIEDSALGLVRCGTEIVGAAVLRPGAALGHDDLIYGVPPSQTWYEGLIYILHEELRSCQRALIVKLADACAAQGQKWLSLGRDAVWCEKGYDTVLREKLRVADSVVFRFESLRRLFAWRPDASEQFLFFEYVPAKRSIFVHNHRCDPESFAEMVAAFKAHKPAGG